MRQLEQNVIYKDNCFKEVTNQTKELADLFMKKVGNVEVLSFNHIRLILSRESKHVTGYQVSQVRDYIKKHYKK